MVGDGESRSFFDARPPKNEVLLLGASAEAGAVLLLRRCIGGAWRYGEEKELALFTGIDDVPSPSTRDRRSASFCCNSLIFEFAVRIVEGDIIRDCGSFSRNRRMPIKGFDCLSRGTFALLDCHRCECYC